MTAFDLYDVVAVPFPFTAGAAGKPRPALVLSVREFHAGGGPVLLATITSVEQPPLPADVPIGDIAAAGLPGPSVVRFRVFSLEPGAILRRLGHLAPEDRTAVERVWLACLGLWSD